MFETLPRVYLLLAFVAGYALVMFFNPIRLALRDGLRCISRYRRVWVTFVVLGFAYFIFQYWFLLTPIRSAADLDPSQMTSVASWHWPRFIEVWQDAPLPALEGVAGIFDNATTTYPISVVAAVLLMMNWRGLHSALCVHCGNATGCADILFT